eukprot:1499258-Rhodomonas_salina.1
MALTQSVNMALTSFINMTGAAPGRRRLDLRNLRRRDARAAHRRRYLASYAPGTLCTKLWVLPAKGSGTGPPQCAQNGSRARLRVQHVCHGPASEHADVSHGPASA